ncbi:MAG: PAS domain S-box protein [Ectothiorhodospiraceae bacterium]|nr:PAS domain S-box protein [Ectothiorhodospiraceae bacterium]
MNLSNSTGDGGETQRPDEFYRTDGSNAACSATWQRRLQTAILDIRSSLVFCDLLQRTVDEVHQLLFGTCELSCVRIYAGDGPQGSQLLAESQAFAGDLGVDPLLDLRDGLWEQQIPPPTHLFVLDNLFDAVPEASPPPDLGTAKSLALPVIISNQLWGILMVQQGSGDRPWQSFEIEGLQLLGCHISQAISQSLQWEARQAIETQDDPRHSQESCADQQQIVQETLTAQKIQETIEEQSAILRSFYNSCPLWMGVEELVEDEINMISYNHASLAVLFDELSSGSGVPRPIDLTDIRPSSEIVELWLGRYHQAQAEQRPIQFEYHYTTDQKTYWFLATVSCLGISCYDHPRFSYVVEDISNRKQDELELKRLKEQLELVIEAASEGFWEINYLTGEYYYSSHWKEMLGYQDHELENSEQTWKRLIVPEDLNAAWQQLEAYRKGEKNDFVVTVRLKHKNGSIRHIYARAIAVKDRAGQVTRIVGSNLDITNLKETEIALQESETNYRRIVENSQEGIWVIDEEGKITFVNPRLLEMLGYPEDEIIGQSCFKFMDLEDERSGINYLQDRKQGLSENHLAQLIKQDGTVLWSRISVTANKNAQGQICGATALLTDMTKILEYQEALKLSKMQLKGILDSSLDGIMAFRSIRDKQGTIIDFEWLLSNPSACELVRRPNKTLIGKRLLVEMPGNREEGLFDAYVQVV